MLVIRIKWRSCCISWCFRIETLQRVVRVQCYKGQELKTKTNIKKQTTKPNKKPQTSENPTKPKHNNKINVYLLSVFYMKVDVTSSNLILLMDASAQISFYYESKLLPFSLQIHDLKRVWTDTLKGIVASMSTHTNIFLNITYICSLPRKRSIKDYLWK